MKYGNVILNAFMVLFVTGVPTATIYSDDNASSSETEEISDGAYR